MKYTLIDPRNFEAFYEGTTWFPLHKELALLVRQVLSGSYGTNPHKIIKDILEDSEHPIILETTIDDMPLYIDNCISDGLIEIEKSNLEKIKKTQLEKIAKLETKLKNKKIKTTKNEKSE